MNSVDGKVGVEEELRIAKERAEKYLDLAGNIILALDNKGKIILMNRKGCEVFNCDKTSCELIGKNWFDCCLPKSNLKEVKEVFNKLMRGETEIVKHYENLILTQKKEERIVSWYNTLLRDEEGKITGVLSSGEDVTERRKAEEELKQSEKKYIELFECSADAIFIGNPKTKKIIDCNKKALELTGYSKKEIVNMDVRDLHPQDKVEETIKVFSRQVKGEKIIHESEILKKDKKTRIPVSINASLIELEGTTKIQGIFRDITDRKKASEELRKTKDYLDNLLNYANAPIIVWDNEENITLFNNAFEAFTGYPKQSIIGKNIEILFHPNQKDEILKTIRSATKGKKWQTVEIPILCKNKKIKIALWNSANLTNTKGGIASTIAQGQDITERKKAEEEIKKLNDELKQRVEVSEVRYKAIYDSSADAIMVLEPPTWKFIAGNSAAIKMFGVGDEKDVGGVGVWGVSRCFGMGILAKDAGMSLCSISDVATWEGEGADEGV